MKTWAAIVTIWIAAVFIFTGVLQLTNDSIWSGIGNFAGLVVLMGLPLLAVVPLLHIPVLRRLRRRLSKATARWWIMPLAGLLCSLPLGMLPTGLLSDSIQGLVTGTPGAAGVFVSVIDSRSSWPFYMLYGLFGGLLGLLFAVSHNESSEGKRGTASA